MKISIRKIFYVVIVSSLFAFTTNSTAEGVLFGWIAAEGQSCHTACEKTGGRAIESGQTGTNPFYVCRANPGNQGLRPGFNQSPGNDTICYVAYGPNTAVRETQYSCLCFQ